MPEIKYASIHVAENMRKMVKVVVFGEESSANLIQRSRKVIPVVPTSTTTNSEINPQRVYPETLYALSSKVMNNRSSNVPSSETNRVGVAREAIERVSVALAWDPAMQKANAAISMMQAQQYDATAIQNRHIRNEFGFF